MIGKPGIEAQNVSIANSTITLASGLELAYYDSVDHGSDAPVLVLLHGYCGSSSYWEQVVADLARFARVIAPDARGHGLSAAPADEIYKMEAFAEDVEELLRQLGIEQAIMLGHSLGGYITLAYAELYGRRLAAFGLIHSTTLPDGEAARAGRDKAAAAIEADGIEAFVEGLVPKLFAADRIGELDMQVAKGKEIGRATSRHGAAATARGMKERGDRGPLIREAELPVLIVAGGKDGIISRDSAFAATGGTTAIVELADAGHMSMLECPEALTASIRDFIGGLAR
jgi:pimeloyl-ACP methyl ester carboxylesterase